MARSLSVLVASLSLAACTTPTLPPLAATHPASPLAPEAAVSVPSTALGTLSASSGHPASQARGTAAAGRAATVYTCPMHPEVRRSKPGQCPKCGMTLVPAAEAADGGHAH